MKTPNAALRGALIAVVVTACGQDPSTDEAATASEPVSGPAQFTGSLTASQIGPIIVGIRRLGFTVVSAKRPRTGICRIAGSATCNFVELAPNETQSYTLTLVGTTAGTFQIQGWTTSSYVPGGFSGSVTVTVH